MADVSEMLDAFPVVCPEYVGRAVRSGAVATYYGLSADEWARLADAYRLFVGGELPMLPKLRAWGRVQGLV